MSSERITRTLKIANGDLLSIESKYLVLKTEISYWETKKQNLSTVYWELKDQIHDLNNIIESLYFDCRERALELRKLQIQKVRLEAEIYKIQNSGEIQSKIREMAKREVEGFLSNRELISKLIFESVIKSMRNEPALFPHPQYDSIPSGATTESFST